MNYLIIIAFTLSVFNLSIVCFLLYRLHNFVKEHDFQVENLKIIDKHLSNVWDRFNSFTEGK